MLDLKRQTYKEFNEEEHQTWRSLFGNLHRCRQNQAVPMFKRGIEILEMDSQRIPSIEDINERLLKATGWRGVPVEGLEDGESFYPALARREFPIGNFIRDQGDLNYTPAPDVFHDLYGHLPFLTDSKYASFCQEFGKRTCQYLEDPQKKRMFERFFWFTAEFALLETDEGRKIFGAGIVSSCAESDYALSEQPEVRKFDVEEILNREFRIDEFQKTLYLLESKEQLYESLDDVGALVENFLKTA